MRWWITIVVAGLVVGACSPVREAGSSTTTGPAPETTTTQPPADACLGGDLPFKSEGLIAAVGEAGADAARISQIRWARGSECERVVVSFVADSGSPASSLGLTGVSILAFAGTVRVDLPPSITDTAIADMLTDGELVDRTYVIRDGEGELSIDIHGAGGVPIAARAVLTSSPATLVIDFARAPDQADPIGAATSDTAVIVSPTGGEALYPFIIESYAQPGLDAVRLQIEVDGAIVEDRAIALPGYASAWQRFTAQIEDGPSGAATIFSGTADANGRPLAGARVSVLLP